MSRRLNSLSVFFLIAVWFGLLQFAFWPCIPSYDLYGILDLSRLDTPLWSSAVLAREGSWLSSGYAYLVISHLGGPATFCSISILVLAGVLAYYHWLLRGLGLSLTAYLPLILVVLFPMNALMMLSTERDGPFALICFLILLLLLDIYLAAKRGIVSRGRVFWLSLVVVLAGCWRREAVLFGLLLPCQFFFSGGNLRKRSGLALGNILGLGGLFWLVLPTYLPATPGVLSNYNVNAIVASARYIVQNRGFPLSAQENLRAH